MNTRRVNWRTREGHYLGAAKSKIRSTASYREGTWLATAPAPCGEATFEPALPHAASAKEAW